MSHLFGAALGGIRTYGSHVGVQLKELERLTQQTMVSKDPAELQQLAFERQQVMASIDYARSVAELFIKATQIPN